MNLGAQEAGVAVSLPKTIWNSSVFGTPGTLRREYLMANMEIRRLALQLLLFGVASSSQMSLGKEDLPSRSQREHIAGT